MEAATQELFSALPTSRFPRRTLLGVPLIAGLAAAVYPRERKLPDPAEPGSGPIVHLTLLGNDGRTQRQVEIRSLLRSDAEWRKELTSEAFLITRRKGTEFAFANRYWDSHSRGLYYCICCGIPLFRSEDKFNSGTGWPSFTRAFAERNIYTQPDTTYVVKRTEVLCRKCSAHLGHVFDDGPPPTSLRYCLNSAALRLVEYR